LLLILAGSVVADFLVVERLDLAVGAADEPVLGIVAVEIVAGD